MQFRLAYMNKLCCGRSLVKTLSSFSRPRLASFSSAATPRRVTSSSSDESEEEKVQEEGGSAVYRHVLRSQRPTRIKWKPQLVNSVSFIGSVDRPVEKMDTKPGRFGTHTVLKVREHENLYRTFRVGLQMWGDIARTCIEHLKLHDLIYVSGRLGCYFKPDQGGILLPVYMVTANELCYVAQHDKGPTCKQPKHFQSETHQRYDGLPSKTGETCLEKNRLYIWQLFFASPREWWDNRKNKKNPKSPDFKHKVTGECLWLSPNDPPWVKRQLQLIDSKLIEYCQEEYASCRSRMSEWTDYDLRS